MKKVTTEEYVNALLNLQQIRKEEEEYEKRLNIPKNHLKDSKIFEILILSLTKTNKELKSIAKNIYNNFLKEYSHNKKLYNLYKDKIFLIIYNYYINLSNTTSLDLDPESLIIINNNEAFSIVLDDLKEISKQIYKNQLEIKKVKELLKNKEKCLNIKKNYQNPKKRLKKRKK